MKICFVHVRVSIASGHGIPDITYEAPLLSDDSKNRVNLHLEKQSDGRFLSTPPLKYHRRAPEVLPPIKLDSLDEDDLREALLRLKGFRHDRELIIETFTNSITYTKEAFDSEQEMSSSNVKNTKVAATTSIGNVNIAEKTKTEGQVQTTIFGTEQDDTGSQTYAAIVSHKSQSKISVRSNSRSGRYTPSLIDNPKLQMTSIPFFSGNPAVDITNGVVHLYKTNFRVPVSEELPPPQTKMLCMLSVPASIDAHSILEFTAPYSDVIHRMRIIRDRSPNEYMVLITFFSEQDARDFYLNLNNQSFSSLIPEEICHLVFVASVEALAPHGKEESKGEAYLPLPNSTELPDCMVCLERMDESVQGLLTILCNHSFHAACLRQWEDLCCPVCRYVQTPEPQNENKCMVCGASEELWICLVCGNVGCGRYTSEHAQRHYQETHHNYAMALSDNRVWDYAGDYFVHRLFQNKEDGKLIEKRGTGTEEGNEAKLEGIQLECMYLLTSQLESQRKYWEEQVSKVEKKAAADLEQLSAQLPPVLAKCEEMSKTIKGLEKEKQSLHHRNENLTAKLRDALRDLANERELNKSLNQNQDEWKKKVLALEERRNEHEEEIKELKDQLRDIMFYIEASQKVKNEDKAVQDEIKDGQLVVGPAGPSGQSGSGRTKGRSRKSR